MAISFLVVGESGTGKSTSLGQLKELGIKGLDPKETVIINVMGKPLPFKKAISNYQGKLTEGGNYVSTNNAETIIKALKYVNESRPDIKNVVLDDFQYLMGSEFMERSEEKGYEKFTSIAKHAYDVITTGNGLRNDINFICFTHSELDPRKSEYKVKTIGKLLDDKINLAGLYTVVLYTLNTVHKTEDGKKVKFNFVTNRYEDYDGIGIPAKSPVGMFKDSLIPNDMGYVLESARSYY